MQSSEIFWFENFENLPKKIKIPIGGASIFLIKSRLHLSIFVNKEFSSLYIPTNETISTTYILRKILANRGKSLVIGDKGCGKTTAINIFLDSLGSAGTSTDLHKKMGSQRQSQIDEFFSRFIFKKFTKLIS